MKYFIPYSAEERTITLPPGIDFRRPGTVDPFEHRKRMDEAKQRYDNGLIGLAGLAAAQQNALQNVVTPSAFNAQQPPGYGQAASWLVNQLVNPRYL